MQQRISAEFSRLELLTGDNTWRNIGLWGDAALSEHLSGGVVPNLIGFEVLNSSPYPVFIENLGLAKLSERKKYHGECYDVIQSIKSESKDGVGIEVKPYSKFTTYCLIDDLLLSKLSEGVIFPVIETASKKRRIYGNSGTIGVFSEWLIKQNR